METENVFISENKNYDEEYIEDENNIMLVEAASNGQVEQVLNSLKLGIILIK